MIRRSLFAVALLACSSLAAPVLTTIQDVLYKADGAPFNGTLTISWNSFQSADVSPSQGISLRRLCWRLSAPRPPFPQQLP